MTVILRVLFLVASLANIALPVSHALQTGEYFRPSGSDVSGVIGANTPYRRCPCPAVNTLANHGFINRNGQDITPKMLRKAIMQVFNIDSGFADFLVSSLPNKFSLDLLSTHNAIEHDVSLVHTDSIFGEDPAQVNITMANDLFSRANSDGFLDVSSMASVTKARIAECQATNPACDYGFNQQQTQIREASVLMRSLGGSNTERISVAFAKSFLVDEKIPDGYTKPSTSVSLWDVGGTNWKIMWQSFF